MKFFRLSATAFALVGLPLFTTSISCAKPPLIAPGKYSNWDGRIQEVEVLQPFHLKDYATIEVLPPDVSAIPIPTDNTRDAVRQTLTDAAHIISEELDGELPGRMKIKAEPLLGGMSMPARALALKVKFVSLDPGSRSKRSLSFGNTGKASVVLSGELADATTNQPLLRFTVRNDDGGHGDYEHVLEENLQHAVDHLSKLIKAFYP